MSIGVLFDLDGTLLDTLEDLTDAVNYALGQFGCPARSMDEVRAFVGNGARKLIERSLPGEENDPPTEQVLGVYQAYYGQHSQCKTAPYPGILGQLKQIAQKYPIAIVSNKPDVSVKPMCKAYFGDVFALGETPRLPRKPAPDMLYRAMAEIGVDKCVYVGDSEVDVTTGRNAGAKVLSVVWGLRDKACLEQAGAEHFCQKPEELYRDLTALLQEEEENGK